MAFLAGLVSFALNVLAFHFIGRHLVSRCATLRLKLLKIGALLRVTVQKVWVSLAGGYPYAKLFRQIYAKLSTLPRRCWTSKTDQDSRCKVLSPTRRSAR